MAFSGAVLRLLTRSAVGIVTGAAGTLTEGELTRRLMAANPLIRGQPFQAYQSIARRAARIVAAGQTFADLPNLVPSRSAHPIDPSIDPGAGQYQYRVVVRITAQDGSEYRTLATIQSDTPLSAAQVYQQVSDDIEGSVSQRRSTRAAVAAYQIGGTVDFLLITAGRRG